MENFSVGVVGIGTPLGREVVSVLEERQFPVGEIQSLIEGPRRKSDVQFRGTAVLSEQLSPKVFSPSQLVFFAGGSTLSKRWVDVAVQQGANVVDLSSTYRNLPNIPLVVPEVNGEDLRKYLESKGPQDGLLVTTPNCSSTQLAVVLKPLQQRANIRRVVVSTYQSVSGAGKRGMEELWEQTLAIYRQETPQVKKFPHQIAFNCIPQVDSFLEDGTTAEETKVVQETRKLLHRPDLKMSVTAVRVPVFICHSQAVNIEFDAPVSAEEARQLLRESPGIVVSDRPEESEYPVGIDVGGTEATYVGRIRQDSSVPNGLNLWIVADNLRKGGALNAVQVAEVIVQKRNLSLAVH